MARIPWPGILHFCGEGTKVGCNKGRIFKGRLLGVSQKLDVERRTKSFRGLWVGTGCNAALYMCTDPRLRATQKRKSEDNLQSWSLEAWGFTQPCKFYIIGAPADIQLVQFPTTYGQWAVNATEVWSHPEISVTIEWVFNECPIVSADAALFTNTFDWFRFLPCFPIVFFFFFPVRKSITPK